MHPYSVCRTHPALFLDESFVNIRRKKNGKVISLSSEFLGTLLKKTSITEKNLEASQQDHILPPDFNFLMKSYSSWR
jgi:hypothetical protein